MDVDLFHFEKEEIVIGIFYTSRKLLPRPVIDILYRKYSDRRGYDDERIQDLTINIKYDGLDDQLEFRLWNKEDCCWKLEEVDQYLCEVLDKELVKGLIDIDEVASAQIIDVRSVRSL